ncbi:hypothetical protein QJQ45_003106 [Haematococcus lacustris]|nr:hypothetical protein QJQ45_003106 [Haematococcus lacustris]
MPGMLAGVDLILGADWLSYYDAVLKPKHGVCTLQATNSGKPENLFALRPKHLPGFAAVAEMEKQRCKEATGVLSAGQTARLLRQGCSSWLMLVQSSDGNDKEGWHTGSLAAAVVGSEGARSAEVNPWLVPAAQLEGLLAEFADVFESMPEGLPPDRKVGHTIRLEPGAVPPYRRMYKLSPREDAEVRKQVAELLAKGLIEPSSSPYGAPILFVQKKDGILRMITEEDVPKTAFLTPVGQFQFKVLCFGLTNAPTTFQRVMNTVFKPLINKSVLVYIDDILVMSNTPEEHLVHLREVLQLMREHKLYAKMSKCEFNQPKLVFLGHIVGGDGIAVDPAKVQVVKDWPAPRSVKDLQAFLGLANYFRRFIPNFSAIAAPLTNLTSKEAAAKYNWAVVAGAELAAFNALKEALCSAPVLALPDFTKAFVVCTDASLLGTGGVLMQEGRPIAYTSKKLSPAETRYTTGEQELLAIVRAVREWRCYLDGAVDVTIETDHNPLIYLQTQTTLSRRQTRWMEELSRYKYEIKYKPGVHNVADPISRNPALAHQDTPAGCDNISVAVAVLSPWADGLITVMTTRSQAARLHENAEMERVIAREAAYREGKLAPRDLSSARLLPPARPGAHSGRDNDHRSGYKVLHADLVEARLHARPRAQPGGEEDLASARLLPNASPGAPKRTTQHADLAEARLHARPRAQPGGEEDLASARLLPNASPGARSSQADHPPEDLASARLLPPARPGAQPGGGEALQRTTPQPTTSKQGDGKPVSDPLTLLQAIRSAYDDDERFNNEAYTSQLHRLEGLWLTENGKVVVPNSKPLRQRVMRIMHDNQAAGHLGVSKTLDQVTRWFDWAGVSEDVRHYVRNSHSCQVNKASSLKPAGKLRPLPIPLRAWDSVSMDLIVKLPASGPQKYDSILVFVDRLTKMVHLVKTWESITDPQYAKLFIEHVFRLHGMPRDVISDRGPQFKNHFWAEVAKLLWVQVNLSSAYHPQTDGQTERMNRVKVPRAHDFVLNIRRAVEQARLCLEKAQKRQKVYADGKRRHATFAPGDMVLLSTQNMRGHSAQPGVRKLKPRYVGPFEVQYMVGEAAVKLELPQQYSRFHNVFHVSLEKPYRSDGSSAVPGVSSPPPEQWLDGETVYTVERVLDHRLVNTATPSTAAGIPAGAPVAAGAPNTGTAPAANNTPSLSAAAPVFADVEKITGLQPAQALDLLRSVLSSLNSIASAQPQAAPVPPATAAGVGPLSYAGALTAAPILPEVGTSAAAAAADEIQRLRQQLVGVTAHLEAAQNEAVRVRAELSEMESLQDRQNVVVSGEQGVAALRSQSDRPVVNRNSGTSAALPAPGAAPALSGTVAPVAPLSGRQTPLSQVAPPANATLAAPVPMSRVKIPGPDKWTDQCLATSRVAEIFCEDLEVHCAYLRIDPADALPNFLTGKAREVWYPATRNAHILAHGSRPTWAHLRASFKEMAGDDLRNESDVHRRKLLDPNALRMSAGSTLNAYITDFRNTLTVAGSTCMAPAMLVATFIRGLTSELQSSVVHDLALMRDPTLNDAIQAAVNAQKVLFAVATNHVGRRPPAPHVAAFVPPKQMNRIRTFPGPAGGPPPPAHRGPYWDVSSSSSSGGHRGSRHSSQGGGRHAGRAAQAPPATAPVCPAPAAGGSTLPIPGYACHHCWNPNHFRDYCNLKHLPADEARRVSGYPRPASLGPPSRHANPPGDLPPRPQKRDRSPPGKGGWKQQGSRGDRRR